MCKGHGEKQKFANQISTNDYETNRANNNNLRNFQSVVVFRLFFRKEMEIALLITASENEIV